MDRKVIEQRLLSLFKTMDRELKGTFVEDYETDVIEEKNYTIEEYINITYTEWLPYWIVDSEDETKELYQWLKVEIEKIIEMMKDGE